MYVVIEGIDGCGKDTQAVLLMERLRGEEGEHLLVGEPDTTMPAGTELRQLLKSGQHVEAHAGLFLANRTALQTHVVKPVLDRGDTVVSIRSFVSTLVYQQENWPLDWLFAIHRQMPVRPNLILIFDLPAQTGLDRASKRPGHNEHYERLDTLERVRQRYLRLANPDMFQTGPKLRDFVAGGGMVRVVDAARPIDEVRESVWEAYHEAKLAAMAWASS